MYLAEAYKGLQTEKKLVIAGGSSDTDEFTQELKRQVGNNENVIFTGFVAGRLREELYSNAYVYVLPSDLEGMPELRENNEMDGPVFKIKDDPRITRVGHIIRKCSIDELPQLWNILKGDMSIVGPRPALPSEVEQYTEYQRQRLYVTPGLTCYWQIQPHRNEISFNQWMLLDIKYIKERSFLTDWKVIFKTVGVVLRGGGE
ncbi:MAG: sugar transferase [Lachnospiraceae bacterium]|nr:sugar transferase [Lachnospiraceae bacterium]